MNVVVAITGASGSIIGLRLIEELKKKSKVSTIISNAGKKVLTSKAGIDATIPFEKKDKSFKKERYGKVDVKKYL